MHESEKWKWSRSVVPDPQWPHGLQPTRLLRPWDSPGKSAGVGAIAFSMRWWLQLWYCKRWQRTGSEIFSIFWFTVAVSNTLIVKHWSEEVGKLGQQEGLLSKPYIWWSRTSPPMTREVPHFKYPHHQSNLPVTLEQFWHFKDLFLTFLSKCVSPLSHFLKINWLEIGDRNCLCAC